MSSSFTDLLEHALLPHPPDNLGVAVSGGGDSMALLHLLDPFCRNHGIQLHAVTVDHQLRPEAAAEARFVARRCKDLGVPHDTLVWQGWDGQGNLQKAARDARYREMTAWARSRGISAVALGHTREDQAETVLMRLGRRAGVDGLSGMRHRVLRDGICWLRPLLRAHRADLRTYLVRKGVEWIDDPSNDDLNFDRIKARQILDTLAPLGISVDGLADVADQMAQARKALEWQAFLVAQELATTKSGAVIYDERVLRSQPDEIRRRLFVRAINWISGATYAPRRGAVAGLMQGIAKGQASTADGCHIRRIAEKIWIFRELNAVAGLQSPIQVLWDGRWRITPPADQRDVTDTYVRALGQDGIENCPDWRGAGTPHVVLLSTPSIWRGAKMIAAPLAGLANNWHADIEGGEESFFAGLLPY